MIAFLRPWLLLGLLSLPIAWLLSRGISGKRRVLALRLAALGFLVLAAAGPRVRAPSDAVSAMFVLDMSDSMGRSSAESLGVINRLTGEMSGEDRAGLVTVAATAGIDTSLRPGRAPFRTELIHDGGRTGLADGIYAAAGALADDGSERRIVLVSDGRDSEGGLEDAIAFAVNSGISVDVVPAGEESESEVLVESLSVPGNISSGEVHSLTAVISADRPTAARILIARDGEFIGEDRQGLKAGTQRRSWEMPGAETGTHVYEIIVDPAADGSRENNRGITIASVSGPPRVMWVGEGRSAVPEALEVQGHRVERRLPGDLPDSITGYSGLEAVILDNVSARDLSLRSMDILESWVRTRGGGLMMVGGDAAFGPGGWQATSIERALPVDMDAPSSLYIPSLTMVMVVDKSGSMSSATSTGFTKLDLVKEAVLGAADVLNPLFSVGLLAFDADYEWTVPVTSAGNADEIRAGLAGLNSGGGTVLYPAILEAYNALVASPSSVRHLVILSDGLGEKADYGKLVDAVARDGITVSTVAVGADAAHELMEAIALQGGGRYWYAEEATQVPRIFASESMIVSRGLTVEETVFPAAAMPAEALGGVDLSLIPPVHGYVMTYPNTASIEALRSPRGHPILVYGQHGLGRTVAFTSDLRSGWGRDWAAWDQLPRLLSQSVRWMGGSRRAGDVAFSMNGNTGLVRLVLEARTAAGGYWTDLEPTAAVTGPDRQDETVPMFQTSPGRYEGVMTPGTAGIYAGTVTDAAAGLMEEAWWTRAYAPELGRAGIDEAALAEAARLGGGRLLDPALLASTGSDWWTVRRPSRRTRFNLTALMALSALLFFLADIALRESESWRREPVERGVPGDEDMEALILKGRETERHKPQYRRPSAAQAARLLAQRRMEREGRGR